MTILTSNNNSIVITYNNSSGPYVNASYNDARAIDGDVRYNNTNLEVYSNGCWIMVGEDSTNIQLSYRWEAALVWAEQKMLEEQKEKELLDKHPALQKAKDNYNTIKALVEND